jgi:hypothetical protein
LSTINRTGTISIGSASTIGTYNANGDMTLNGGLLQRADGSTFALAPGKTLTIQNAGKATFAGSYATAANASYQITGNSSRLETTGLAPIAIENGATVNVTSGGRLASSLGLDVGRNGNGTLTMSTATVTAPGGSIFGDNGNTANLTFSGGGTALFSSSVQIARSPIAGTTGTVTVQSNARLTVGSLSIAADGGNTTVGTLNVQGAGSSVSQSGSNPLTVGHSSTGTAAINVGTTSSGATFTTGTGAVTINKTGTVTVGNGANTGTFSAKGNMSIDGGLVQVGQGSFVGSSLPPTSISLTNSGILRGLGTVSGAIQNAGIVQPGLSTPGTLTINGSYAQTSIGALHVDLASAASYDRLAVTGAATLSGSLTLSAQAGYIPTPGTSFDVLDWGSRSGTFIAVLLPFWGYAPIGWDLSQLYTTGVITAISTAGPGDFDSDGDVDGADFVTWQTNFPAASGHTRETGDADGDGDVDGADFVVWQTNFPSPPAPGITPVPEPAGALAASFAMVAMLLFYSTRHANANRRP